MKSHLGLGLVSLAAAFFEILLQAAFQPISPDWAFAAGMAFSFAWALGAVLAYVLGPIRRHSDRAKIFSIAMFAVSAVLLRFSDPLEPLTFVFTGAAGLAAGLLQVTLVCLRLENDKSIDVMRDAFVTFLLMKGLGLLAGALGAAALVPETRVQLLPLAASLVLAPIALGGLSLVSLQGSKFLRGLSFVLFALTFALAFVPSSPRPENTVVGTTVESARPSVVDLSRAPYLVRTGRPLDTFLLGAVGAEHIKSHFEAGARSVTAVASGDFSTDDISAMTPPQNVVFEARKGSGRRRLESEGRRFDLIQIYLESDGSASRPLEQSQGLLTVEAFRVYFDHLKDEGMIQIVPPAQGLAETRAQAALATIAEAWKRSARKDIDLHSVVVGLVATSEVDVLLVSMKPVLREERDRLGAVLRVGQLDRGWVLPSDSPGPVATDDRPSDRSVSDTGPGGYAGWLVGLLAGLTLLALVVWISAKERRKGAASRWQTFSIAVFFGGLGLSLALFSRFFEIRAIRGWGVPTLAAALVMAGLAVFFALGAQLLAGHPKRRFGVRIQPLANFVFMALFAYLAGAVAEPLVASGAEWFSVVVGISVLIPYGLLGGSFFPNAVEEAAEKLHPKSVYLLWASFASGGTLGVYVGSSVGASVGLSAVFLSAVFVFSWVAIIGGLVRPFSTRKIGDG